MSDPEKRMLAISKEENRIKTQDVSQSRVWRQSFPSQGWLLSKLPRQGHWSDLSGKSQGHRTRRWDHRHYVGQLLLGNRNVPYLHSLLFNIIKFVVLKHGQKLSCLVNRVDQVLSDFLSLVCTAAATQFFFMKVRKENKRYWAGYIGINQHT